MLPHAAKSAYSILKWILRCPAPDTYTVPMKPAFVERLVISAVRPRRFTVYASPDNHQNNEEDEILHTNLIAGRSSPRVKGYGLLTGALTVASAVTTARTPVAVFTGT